MGMVCDAMIHGSSPRSSTRLCTTPIAISTPSSMPSAKPSKVADSVTPAWKIKLRGLSMSLPNTLPHQSATIWCGAGSTGRSIDQAASTSSRAPHGLPRPFKRSITCGALSHTAPAYQTTIMAATTSATGPIDCVQSVGSVFIAVPGAQRGAHALRDLGERHRLAHVEAAARRQTAVDHLDDAPGPWAHHDDAVGQEHRLRNRVGDEDHRLAGALPQPQ